MAKYSVSEPVVENIIQTCSRLFYENGYENTTYNLIVQESGVSRGSVYYHFKDKHNMLYAVYERFTSRCGLDAEEIMEAAGHPDNALACSLLGNRIYARRICRDERLRSLVATAESTLFPMSNGDMYMMLYQNDQSVALLKEDLLERYGLDNEISGLTLAYYKGGSVSVINYLQANIDRIDYEQYVRFLEERFGALLQSSERRKLFAEALELVEAVDRTVDEKRIMETLF